MKITFPNNAALNIDGNQVFVLIGDNIQEGVAGFGDTLPEALRDLASNIEKEKVTVECVF